MAGAVLSLNAGSSSLKFALFRAAEPEPKLLGRGQVEGIGSEPHLYARGPQGEPLAERRWPGGGSMTHEAFLEPLLAWVTDHFQKERLIGVGHRVVHGGCAFSAPAVIDAGMLETLTELVPLAPLHQPHNLAAIRAALAAKPRVPQIACFDTAFHRTQPVVATRFALPRALEAEGVRRYGFHGLSYEYISRRLADLDPAMAGGRVIAAHLGSGASLCALKAGVSVDTTMGFTALDGLVMGSRCGALDAGVILYLLQQHGMEAGELEELLYRRSGLLGVSGVSSDMRALLLSPRASAKEAVDLFVYRLAAEAGAMASALGGVDGIVFTAGIGEHAPEIRGRAVARLAWLGAELDDAANAANAEVISAAGSRVKVRIIPTDEERMIAIHTLALIANGA